MSIAEDIGRELDARAEVPEQTWTGCDNTRACGVVEGDHVFCPTCGSENFTIALFSEEQVERWRSGERYDGSALGVLDIEGYVPEVDGGPALSGLLWLAGIDLDRAEGGPNAPR